MPEKKLFGKKIQICDVSAAYTYAEDISPIFSWMQDIELPEKPTILDIGANLGLFSLSYAVMFKEADIYCFEPVPYIFEYLKENLKLNSHFNFKINANNLGMSNRQERKKLSIPTSSQHDRYMHETDIRHYSVLGKGNEKIDGEFIALDQWVNDAQLNSVDFIKIDVEGYEYSVLQGATETLKAFKPIVKFELNQLTLALSNRSASDYLNFAKDHGYEVFGQQYGYKRELLPVKSTNDVHSISDLILFPNE